MKLASIQCLCSAFQHLLPSLLEVVIHDLKTGKIAFIEGKLSKRIQGDPSLIKGKIPAQKEMLYSKTSFDGKLLQSISIRLEDFLVCMNIDTSPFQEMQDLAHKLLSTMTGEKPKSLFGNDWQERVHTSIKSFLEEKGWSFSELNKEKRQALVAHLYELGAFKEKKSADYLASILQVGRATIFNYLRGIKQ